MWGSIIHRKSSKIVEYHWEMIQKHIYSRIQHVLIIRWMEIRIRNGIQSPTTFSILPIESMVSETNSAPPRSYADTGTDIFLLESFYHVSGNRTDAFCMNMTVYRTTKPIVLNRKWTQKSYVDLQILESTKSRRKVIWWRNRYFSLRI